MDLELQMKRLLDEEAYLNEMLSILKKLKARSGYDDCTTDIIDLIDKLKDKKTNVTDTINELSNEIISAAECFGGIEHEAADELMW